MQYTDVNECKERPRKCHTYADCSNTVGSYYCRCKEGFRGDGITCVKGKWPLGKIPKRHYETFKISSVRITRSDHLELCPHHEFRMLVACTSIAEGSPPQTQLRARCSASLLKNSTSQRAASYQLILFIIDARNIVIIIIIIVIGI